MALDFLLGAVLYSLLFLLILVFSNKRIAILYPLLAFYTISISLGFIQSYITFLPQGGSDAVTFFNYSVEWSSGGIGKALSYYTGANSYFMSWLMAIFFSIFTPSMFFASAMSAVFTFFGILATYSSVKLLWGESIAIRVLILACFFPTTLLHSAIFLREAYVAAFFSIGIYAVIRWVRGGKIRWFFLAHLAFFISVFFHGGMVVANIALLFYSLFFSLRKGFLVLQKRGVVSPSFIVFALLVCVAVVVLLSGLNIPKIGNVSDFVSQESLVDAATSRAGSSRGGAAHPTWTLINSDIEFIPKLPVRVSYFLFSPFPWDIRSPHQLVGLIDSFLYLFMFFGMVKFRRIIFSKPELVPVFFIILLCVIAFSLGTTNFGTGIRHRAKFVFSMMLIASPAIFSLFNRIKLSR